jgi:hypothetical protein
MGNMSERLFSMKECLGGLGVCAAAAGIVTLSSELSDNADIPPLKQVVHEKQVSHSDGTTTQRTYNAVDDPNSYDPYDVLPGNFRSTIIRWCSVTEGGTSVLASREEFPNGTIVYREPYLSRDCSLDGRVGS